MAQVSWAMILKSIILLLISSALHSAPLPNDHFLAPRDKEVMWLTGIETPANARALARLHINCKEEGKFNSCEWFESFSHMQVSKLETHNFTQNAQITFFGERHIDRLNQESMAQIIRRAHNLDVLALEMFNVEDQIALDAYSAGTLSLEELKKVLDKAWNYNDEGYLEMLKVAKEKNLKILAIDQRSLFDDLVFSENLIERDKHMAKVLSKYLSDNPAAAIFVYTGKMHSFASLSKSSSLKSVTEILKENIEGLEIKNYFLFSKKENALPLHTMRILSSEKDQVVVESEALKPYVDGAVFLSL